MFEKRKFLEEINIPDNIFYEKYSIKNIIIYNIVKNSLVKNAVEYKLIQEREFDRKFSWNEIKKILILEKNYNILINNTHIDLWYDINNEIAKEELESFLKNIKNFLIVEKLILIKYIENIEQMLIYNNRFKVLFLKEFHRLIFNYNMEIAFILRFFRKKEAIKIIYDYMFKNTSEEIINKKYTRKQVVEIVFLISNMCQLEDVDKIFFINNFLLSAEEESEMLKNLEFLENLEAENE